MSPRLITALVLLHIGIIALANYTVQFAFEWRGVYFSPAMFIYPFGLLATDLTIRLSDAASARRIVAFAYIPAIIISIALSSWRIGIASGCAYLFGQLLDLRVFQMLRARFSGWWVAPLFSTMAANVLDTYLFYSVAFHRAADYPDLAAHWPQIASVDLAFKLLVSAALFLPLYRLLLGWLRPQALRAGAEKT